jgi:hypothetical protein
MRLVLIARTGLGALLYSFKVRNADIGISRSLHIQAPD